eukprot:gene14297-30422_t
MMYFTLSVALYLVINAVANTAFSLGTSFRTNSPIIMANASNSSKKEERRPWEFGRFLKTVGFYEGFKPNIPILSKLLKRRGDGKSIYPNDILWSTENKSIEWGPLDDVVMGGVSKSNLSPGQKFDGRWTGIVTSANNGGFAGIRTKLFQPPLDASNCKGIILRLQGDGNRFKCIARDNDEWNGIAWSKSFDTIANKIIEVKISFDDLIPTRFAKSLPTSAPFNKKTLSAIQLTLSKFEYDGGLNPKFKEGEFALTLESIRMF